MLFLFQTYSVMNARRRVHKQLYIQPNNQESEPPLDTLSYHSGQIKNTSNTTLRTVELFMVVSAVAIPFLVHASLFQNFIKSNITAAETAVPEVVKTGSSLDIPVLSAVQNSNLNDALGGGDVLAQDNALISTGPVGADEISAAKHTTGEISVYTVRDGDSLSQIAEMFGVTTNTILWANDIPRGKSIQPGDTLVILPVVGVRYIVKKGDTIGSIAKKYDGDAEEIISYNQLASATDLTVGETLVIPGGELHTSEPVKNSAGISVKSAGVSGGGWLVKPVPGAIKTQGRHGYNAVDFGLPVGSPVHAASAGEVIVSKSSGWNGGYGQYIVIRHSNGVQTLYAHLSRNDVGVGSYISQNQVIGASGNTGKSTGPHLHFEVRGGTNPF